ncbi:metallophosphoesterase [Deinococcus wulumuqiensis]|uniref:Metallophosphoesterase n=1 Tax=Deinococcus wulumuqiensis TaxID=980427 RepID=A0AAV4K5I0_9DEIO|nr:metallophosphoesterase [Deinococcus wulumuqiensis]QII21557.1 metallophosphoesterase [Deinococcus wulumuqiensis R12]GGI83927.1 putative metallophosphoesterase [Deinococcus wulumuqiensis]GGP29722.1 putative metallophosphoesterase [Deinococcus wulumuqiensis]
MSVSWPGPARLPHDPPPDPQRRVLLRRLLAGTLAGGVGASFVAQGYRFGVTHEQRALTGLTRPVRLALLTDLHYGLYIGAGSARRWVDATLAQRPDLILLGGDLVDRRFAGAQGSRPLGALLAELGRLRAPLGVYAVWGNHDYGSFGRYGTRRLGPPVTDWAARREALRLALERQGVTVLLNGGRPLRDDLWLGGVDDLWLGEPDVAAALRGAGRRATVLLSHNPDVLLQLPAQPGLTLSGHTHGGQVRLPWVGALQVPADPRFTAGWVQGPQGAPAYVSRGLGMSGLPFRNLCKPEITLLTLTPPAT